MLTTPSGTRGYVYIIYVVLALSLGIIFLVILNSSKGGAVGADASFESRVLNHIQAKNPNNFKILVTGGSGFIGSHIVQLFDEKVEQCSQILVLDNFASGHIHNLQYAADEQGEERKEPESDGDEVFLRSGKIRVIKGSITNKDLLEKLFKEHPEIKYVFHLGALISAAGSVYEPKEYTEVNTQGTITLLMAITQYAPNVERVVFSSSAALYGSSKEVPKREAFKTDCQSPYAQSKLDGEYYCQLFSKHLVYPKGETSVRKKPISCIALRYFNVFGERQDPNSAYAAAIPIFLKKAIEKKPIEIYGDGAQTRDFVYVKDVALANTFAATMLDPSVSFDVFNVGYGKSIEIRELAKIIVNKVNAGADTSKYIKFLPERPGDVKISLAAVDKLLQKGWRPRYNFADAFEKTIQYFLTTVKKD